MVNGNKALDIEIVQYITSKWKDGLMQSWEGIAKINGHVFNGEFAVIEVYNFDDTNYRIDWRKELKGSVKK